MKTKEKNQRCEEFLSCLGNGKTIYQIEVEEELKDKKIERRLKEKNDI